MATRNTRANKATKTPVSETIEVETKAIPDEPSFSWTAYIDSLKAQIPDNWKRHTVAFITGLLVSVGVGYAIGAATLYMLIGASATGASAFVQVAIYLIGLITSMYVGQKTASYAYASVMDHTVDKAYARVRNVFTRTPQGAAA